MAVLWVLAASALASLAFWYDFRSWQRFGMQGPKTLFNPSLCTPLTARPLGTGGTPPTLRGYLKIRRWGLYLLFQNQNLLDSSPISNEGPSYLSSDKVPKRSGTRPSSTRWTLPQRQHPYPIKPTAKKTLSTLMHDLAASPSLSPYIYQAPSKTEGGTGAALYLRPDSSPTANPNASKIFYEIAHVHPNESSLHVYVSPKDARTVIESGWGQRFSVPWLAPSSWIHVYAPRDDDEVETVRGIVRAGVCFAVGKSMQE